MPVYALAIVILFAFGSTIFYVLLLIERRVWRLLTRRAPTVADADVRFVHRILKHLIPVLPPSNGVVVFGGLACLLWQAIDRNWDWPALTVLVWYAALQLYILVFGRIAQAIKYVARTPGDADAATIRRGTTNLVRQHRNGFIHAAGVLLLETLLIIAPTLT